MTLSIEVMVNGRGKLLLSDNSNYINYSLSYISVDLYERCKDSLSIEFSELGQNFMKEIIYYTGETSSTKIH
jgi:hypothetical protein